MCHPPTCVYRVYIAACCVVCLIGAVAVIAIGMALGYRMGEDSVYNFKENRPNGVAVSATNREQMLDVQSHFKHITTSLTGSGIVSGTISMIGGYGACCNLALALYLFMVGVAMLVVAEVATGAIVYYKQTLIIETLSEFRQNGICGTICFLDDLVSRQLMSAVVIVIGMTVLQVGQIICAYCIVRRLSTPKPVRNIQHAVRRMTAHLFNIHSTAVAGGAASATSSALNAAVNSSSLEASPALAPNPAAAFIPALMLSPLGAGNNTTTNNNNNSSDNNSNNNQNDSNNIISSKKRHSQSTLPDDTILAPKKITFVSEGAQTDDLEELMRPLLVTAHQVVAEEPPSISSIRRSSSSHNNRASDNEIVEVIEETTISNGPQQQQQQKSCLRYSVSSRPQSISSQKDVGRSPTPPEVQQPTRVKAEVQQCAVAVNVRASAASSDSAVIDSAQAYRSSITKTTDYESPSNRDMAVVNLQSLSSNFHQHQHATTTNSNLSSSSTASTSQKQQQQPQQQQQQSLCQHHQRNKSTNEQTAGVIDAVSPVSSSLTHQSSTASRSGRVAKLIPSSQQSSLPAPHFVRKLSDFREIAQPHANAPTAQQQQQPHGSPSPSARRRHLMIPVAPSNTSSQQYSQLPQTSSKQTYYVQQTVPPQQQIPQAAQTLRFAELPAYHHHHQPASNIAKTRRARSYTNVDSTENEALEAADYIDLRELRRSPGTPGRVPRFAHLHGRNAAQCSHPQQPPIFPAPPAHAAGTYPDRSQWRLPEIRTLYVSYV